MIDSPDLVPSQSDPDDAPTLTPRIRNYVYGLGKVYGELWDDLTSHGEDEFKPRAAGGAVDSFRPEERFAHDAMRSMSQPLHSGPINSAVAGRTDHIPMSVASGSYVIPADIVSGMGQGNTAAGHKVIGALFRSAPYGGKLAPVPQIKPPKMKFADGGAVPVPVPIMAAGGEHVLTPDQVALVGGGDLDHGHEVLDAWVQHERKKINKEQKNLPGPAKD